MLARTDGGYLIGIFVCASLPQTFIFLKNIPHPPSTIRTTSKGYLTHNRASRPIGYPYPLGVPCAVYGFIGQQKLALDAFKQNTSVPNVAHQLCVVDLHFTLVPLGSLLILLHVKACEVSPFTTIHPVCCNPRLTEPYFSTNDTTSQ